MITKFILKHEKSEESMELAREAKMMLKKFYKLRRNVNSQGMKSYGITKTLNDILTNSNPYDFQDDNESTEEVIHMTALRTSLHSDQNDSHVKVLNSTIAKLKIEKE